eukprot:gene9551-34975_t
MRDAAAGTLRGGGRGTAAAAVALLCVLTALCASLR